MTKAKTIGELKKSGYKARSVKEEIRDNLALAIQHGKNVFEGILGYEHTVIPDIERALLSRHNILLLGLRGQAKTRLARMMVNLLDEYIPVVEGSEINDDPLDPISVYARQKIAEMGDKTPITWLHRDQRYVEKLATPDVSVADLIGDIDPIKAANLRLNLADERVMHYGLIPRAHRAIFVINELPDLQPRIQVSLFNILQEGDLQIRGFHLRLPLDIQFLFTANPEDYTNRGSIITPLKDRIESQILTHYPEDTTTGMAITAQEARLTIKQKDILVPEVLSKTIQHIVEVARDSEFTDVKSGVSARLGITAMEALVSSVERRRLINKEEGGVARFSDLLSIIPAITGKVELVYEGEEEGSYNVALSFIQDGILKTFLSYFPDPEKIAKGARDPFGVIRAFFQAGNTINLLSDMSEASYNEELALVSGLDELLKPLKLKAFEMNAFKELVLNALASTQVISRQIIKDKLTYEDPLANMWDELQ